MKNLIVVRHAKSSWAETFKDIDRPLQSRGIADARLMAEYCLNFIPNDFHVYSSPAARAAATAGIFAQTHNYPSENITYIDALYTFEGAKLAEIVKSFDDKYENILLFGHNHAITDFVNTFGDRYIDNVPTCGFVSIKFDIDKWASLQKGKTIKAVFPKELK